jgi:hypothetical protein
MVIKYQDGRGTAISSGKCKIHYGKRYYLSYFLDELERNLGMHGVWNCL